MDLLFAVVTLFLVMDPLGNVPLFLSVRKTVAPERRRIVLVREVALAYLVLVTFLIVDDYLLRIRLSNRVDRQQKGTFNYDASIRSARTRGTRDARVARVVRPRSAARQRCARRSSAA